MNKTLLIVALMSLLPIHAQAKEGDIVVRLRGTHVSPSESSNLGSITDQSYGAGTAATVYGSAGAKLEVESNTIPEIDISYYFTKNIAAELILALGTRHNVAVSGSGGLLTQRGLGSVNLLPPTLTAQWHFNPDEMFDPYVGAGASYIRALDNGATANTTVGNFPIKTSRNSFGPALQAGLDVNVKDGWLVNFDVKKIWFNKDIELNAPVLAAGFKKVDELGVDPWILSIGLGKKF